MRFYKTKRSAEVGTSCLCAGVLLHRAWWCGSLWAVSCRQAHPRPQRAPMTEAAAEPRAHSDPAAARRRSGPRPAAAPRRPHPGSAETGAALALRPSAGPWARREQADLGKGRMDKRAGSVGLERTHSSGQLLNSNSDVQATQPCPVQKPHINRQKACFFGQSTAPDAVLQAGSSWSINYSRRRRALPRP